MRYINRLALAIALAATSNHSLALEAKGVPRGGLGIPALTGAHAFEVKIRNDTGAVATDVTVTLSSANVLLPQIYELDVTDGGDDKVDDNNNGELGDESEHDTYDANPTATCRTILTTSIVPKGGAVTIKVTTFHDKPFPAGTIATIRFSKKNKAGKHRDLCAFGGLWQFGPLALDVPIGTHLANFMIQNQLPQPMNVFHVITPIDLPMTAVTLEPPHDFVQVSVSDHIAEFRIPPSQSVFPGQCVELDLEFLNQAVTLKESILVVPGPADTNSVVPYGAGCPGTDGFVPVLGGGGNATAGGTMTLWIDEALGGSPALIVGGLQSTLVPLPNGCDLLTTLDLPPLMLPLLPGGPGDGGIAIPFMLPGTTPAGLQLHLQAFVGEPSLPGGYAATNGVTLNIE